METRSVARSELDRLQTSGQLMPCRLAARNAAQRQICVTPDTHRTFAAAASAGHRSVHRRNLAGLAVHAGCPGASKTKQSRPSTTLVQRLVLHGSLSPHIPRNFWSCTPIKVDVPHFRRPAHIGCHEIFLDLPVHTSCTRRLLTD